MGKETKNIIRKKFLNLLRSQEEEERLEKSRRIQDKLFASPEFQKAKTILFYASFDGEVETFRMMKQAKSLGKKIALPKIIEGKKQIVPLLVNDLQLDLTYGPYDIKQPNDRCTEPIPLEEIDLAIVPGVAFDKDNCRLGRGAGYYDRFLSQLTCNIPTIGLAFDFQMTDHLSYRQEHDVLVTRVIVN